MQVLKLIHQHNCQIMHRIGQEMGRGSDGQVFEIIDDYTKVIKLSVLYETQNHDLDQEYLQRSQVLDYLIQNPSPIHARVYEHVKLGEWKRSFDNRSQRYILHYCVMERLKELSGDENKVFHSILSHEDRGVIKNFPIIRLRKILKGLEKGLEFSEGKIVVFLDKLKSAKVRHLDLHQRNVMVDGHGNYRLIDFDRCVLKD